MTSLVDELTQKQVNKFQVSMLDNSINLRFMHEILSNNNEGIFNLSSNINEASAESIIKYLRIDDNNYNFELKYDPSINSAIFFKKKGVQN